MQTKLCGWLAVMPLFFGFASVVSAQDQEKSWEVDVYADGADVT